MKVTDAVLVACLVVGLVALPSAATLDYESVGMTAHSRHLAAVSRALTSGCSLSAASACARTQATCLNSLSNRHNQTQVCGCFSDLGVCLKDAGCLNGTNEDLHTQYCQTGDQYCCDNHGDFNGCGLRDDFNHDSVLCLCEDGYSGTNCNSTSSVICSSSDTCNVCDACCKDYSGDTCVACTIDECDDTNVCSADPAECNTCAACCKPYLEGDRDDCNICVEHECNNS